MATERKHRGNRGGSGRLKQPFHTADNGERLVLDFFNMEWKTEEEHPELVKKAIRKTLGALVHENAQMRKHLVRIEQRLKFIYDDLYADRDDEEEE